MGTVIELAARRLVTITSEPETVAASTVMSASFEGTAGAGLSETIARMRTSLQQAADALRAVATEARASADAYRRQAADIRRQIDGVQAAVTSLKAETVAVSRGIAVRD
jgi:phosphoglycolate phosphatase-like HAD superfamily hydrolase